MKQNLFNKLWLRVGMIVAIMTTALSGTAWAETVTLVSGSGTSNYAVPTGWTTSGTIEGGSYLKFDNGTITSPEIAPHTGLSFAYTVATYGSGTNHPLTIRILNASTNAVIVEKTTATPTSSSYINTDSPLSLGDVNVAFKIQLYAPTGKGVRLRNYSITGTPVGGSSAVATETTIDASGITNTDVYAGTAAGSLSASVTAGGNAVAGATVTWSGNNNSVATIDASTGVVTLAGVGTVTFTASYAGVSGEYQSSTDTYEMTVTSSAPDYATLPFEWAGGASASLLALAGVTANGLGSDYAAGNAPYLVKFDSDGDYIQVKTNSRPGVVTIGVKMIGGSSTSTITVQESVNGETFTEVQALTISGAQNDNLILETTNDFAATTRYVRLLFTKGSNVGVGAISIALPSNDPVISAENVSIEYNTTSGSIDYEIVHPVEGGTISASTEAEWLTFGTTGTAFTATVNNAASARTADVTLTYTYNNSQTVTKDITLTQGGNPEAPGTENNPYTVAQARAAIDAETGVTGVYATGIVSEIVTAYNSQYGNISYNISADGSTESDQLQAYRGKSYNGESFTSANDIQVGDVVVIYGNLKNHQGTYEFEAGNQLVSLVREKTDPTILVEDATIAFGQTYTIDSELIEGGDVTVSVSPEGFATVNGLTITPSKAGSATVTVSTAESNLYNAGSETFTLTVTQPGGQDTAPSASAGETIFYESFDTNEGSGGNDNEWSGQIATNDIQYDNTGWETDNGKGANHCGKFGTGKAGGYLLTPALGQAGDFTLTFKAAAWNGGTEGTTLNLSTDETPGTLSLSEVTLVKGAWTNYSVTITGATAESKIMFYTSAANHRVFLDEVRVEAPASEAPTETYTIPSSGLGTYCSQYPIDLDELPTGVKAYAVTAKGESSVTLTEITGTIKGGVGFILEGSGDVTFTFANSSTEPTNLLVGTLAPEYLAEGTAYGLKSGVFQPNTAGTIKAHRAYLPADAGNAVKALTLIFEDDATGITHTRIVTDEATIYDLTGRRLSQMQKGINIVNGKKILK